MHLFGIKLLGFNSLNGNKVLLTFGFIIAVVLLRKIVLYMLRFFSNRSQNDRVVFWTRQGLSVVTAALIAILVLSVWFDSPDRLATGIGLVTAGIAFALQKVITALAGYVVILRGNTFNVGDRITMGGVRGDVIGLGFIHTTIMEMGQPPAVEPQTQPAMWVQGRQFTGRIVTVTNDKIFEEPIYNYTREFPYIWEEMIIPVKAQDRKRAEQIMLESAAPYVAKYDEITADDRARLEQKYFIKLDDFKPKVYLRITDNWIELAMRFICPDHGAREVKNKISRDLIAKLEQAKIGIASTTYEIVGMPKLTFDEEEAPPPANHQPNFNNVQADQ